MMKTESVPETLADITNDAAVRPKRFHCRVIRRFIIHDTAGPSTLLCATSAVGSAYNGQVFIPHSLSSKYYKAPLVKLSASYQFCPKSYWDSRSGASSSTAYCCTYAVTKVFNS
jgi:hypothetical protein